MSASRRLTRSVSRSTARRSAVALTAAVGLTSVALVAPANAGVPSAARFVVGPFTQADDAEDSSPVTLKATYELDGEKISADDLEGKTGLLEVTYLVRNRTTKPTELRYKDGQGKEIVETVDLVVPYVGRLAVALPERAGDVEAEGAEVLDGSRAWSLVLFNPLGEPAQQLKLTMQVSDAVVPEAQLQVAKLSPTGGGQLTKGTAAAEASATSSAALTESVFKIDSSVLKLRDGATQLLEGLAQLVDGSASLEEGLAGKAAPGAQTLSDGLGSAREGGETLSDGLGKLAAGGKTLGAGLGTANDGGKALSVGLDQLVSGGGRLIAGLNSAADGGGKLAEGLRSSSGEPDLAGGTKSLADGLATVRDGVATLAGAKGLPAAEQGLKDLLFGLDHAPGTLGATDPGGLLQGLTLIAGGLSHPKGAAGKDDQGGVKEGLAAVLDPATGLPFALGEVTKSGTSLDASLASTLPQLRGGAQLTQANLSTALAALKTACATLGKAMVDDDNDASTPDVAAPLPTDCNLATDAVKAGTANATAAAVSGGVQTVIDNAVASRKGLTDLETGLKNAVGGLTAIKAGVDQLAAGAESARAGTANTVVPGVKSLLAGVTSAVTGLSGQLAPGVNQLAAGSATLAEKTALAADGAATLRGGLNELASGGGTLAAGAGSAAAGAKKLSGGLEQLLTGGGTLVAGLDSANAGGAKLADGLAQLDDGAATLATGLNDAADGSGKLADGIVKVEAGVQSVQSGAGELSGRGTSALGGSVNSTARNNALNLAMLQAIGEMGDDAANEGSFDIVLASASSSSDDDGIGTGALLGGAGALALLTMAAAGLLLARRRNGASHSAVS